MQSGSNPTHEPKPMVRPSDILDENAVLLDLDAKDKTDVIRRMVDCLASLDFVTDANQVVTDILRREQVMSTGIGGGIAVPHAQSKGASRLTLALGRLRTPLDFEALDARPVQLVFLLIGPDERGGFIRLLARISRLLYTGDLQRELLGAKTPAQVMARIRQEEIRLAR